MKPVKNAAIVFQKNAVKGKVKTRIAKDLGEERALEIYEFLLKNTYKNLGDVDHMDILLFFSDYQEEVTLKPKSGQLSTHIQIGNDLGQKMFLAFKEAFKLGYEKVLIIGTDCPEIRTVHLQTAMEKLDTNEVVFGPAKDGGYYLLGLKKLYTFIFEGIPWSTDKVLELSLLRLKEKDMSFECLETLSDIDTAKDWEAFLASNPNFNHF